MQKKLFIFYSVRFPNQKFEGLKVADWKGEMREESVCLFCCVYGYWFEGEGPSIKDICKMLACLTLSLLVRFSRNLPVLHNHIIGQIRNPTQCGRHLWMGPKGRERDGAKVFSFSAMAGRSHAAFNGRLLFCCPLPRRRRREVEGISYALKSRPTTDVAPAENTSQ